MIGAFIRILVTLFVVLPVKLFVVLPAKVLGWLARGSGALVRIWALLLKLVLLPLKLIGRRPRFR
jgi:hypothetical protein